MRDHMLIDTNGAFVRLRQTLTLMGVLLLGAASISRGQEPPATDGETETSTLDDEDELEEEEEAPSRALLEWWLESLAIDVKTIEGANGGVGIDVEWEKEIAELYRSVGDTDFGLLASLGIDGRFGTASERDDNTPRSLEITPQIYTHWRVADLGEFDQTIDLGVSPAKLEADQDFDTVNYGFETYLAAPIPYSWWFARGIHRLFGEPTRPLVKPITARAGWTMISRIEDEQDRDTRGRFEVSLSTRIFLRDTVGVTIDARHYFEEGGNDFGFVEVEADLPLSENTRLEISYTDGRLPLSPDASHTLSLGVSLRF